MDAKEVAVEDLLLDQSFQEYCIGSNKDAVRTWTEWQGNNPKRKALASQARTLYCALNGNITSRDFHRDDLQMQAAFADRQQLPAAERKSRTKYLWLSLSGAAACLLVGVYLYFGHGNEKIPEDQVYVSAPGKKTNITLSDGTQIMLNSSSRLIISKDYNQNSRNVILDGEAYFIVKHNDQKVFKVSAGGVDIRDLGTTFNVKAYGTDHTVETSLIEGKIEIINRQKVADTIQLQPNQKLVFTQNDNTAGKATIKPLASLNPTEAGTKSLPETDWIQNKLTFNDESLAETALKIERWYGVKINVLNSADRGSRFTATFEHETLTGVLEALKMSGNFNYRKEEDVISIY